jgi:hypothetical protein
MSTKTGTILFAFFMVVWVGVGAALFAPAACSITGDEDFVTNHHSLSYEISGTASKVFVTMYTPSGSIEQHDSVYLPRTYNYSTYDYWFSSISAQNLGDSGSVTVKIIVDGVVVKQATSTGAYVIAMADYSFY